MKIRISDTNDQFPTPQLILEEVHNPIILRNSSGECFTICMRDSGFEFTYQGGAWQEAKEGRIKQLKEND